MKKSFAQKKLKMVIAIFISIGLSVQCVFAFGDYFRGFGNEGRTTVPIGGNTWRNGDEQGGKLTDNGIENWTSGGTGLTTYIRVANQGTIKLWLTIKVPVGTSEMELTINGRANKIVAEGSDGKDYYAGEWQVGSPGYIAIKLTGLQKTGDVFADVSSLQLEGAAINESTVFVKSNEGNFFYWGRRGPSVHLNYFVPEDENVEWFYNEVTVEAGKDVIGSYFMANGFGEGYFGMQVNSASERRVLFSVWSPFTTDNPNDIPADRKIELLSKGDDVQTGEFGNEGSGGQSYLQYDWKAGSTYRFLLHGKPTDNNRTIYTAYFYSPEESAWRMIASFSRPATNTWLKHLYSFLENFLPEYGDKEREVLFGNQWERTNDGKWISLDKIKFTADNTARQNYRMDYSGGVKGEYFYLRNCGFFNNYTKMDTEFKKAKTNTAPTIDFVNLPVAGNGL